MNDYKNILNDTHFPLLKNIFENNKFAKGNVTKTIKHYCKTYGIDYNDNLRRKGSKIIERGYLGTEETPIHRSPAKILIFDIETSPLITYLWSKWQKSVSDDAIIQDWKLLCYSAKWLFEDEIISDKMTEKELEVFDDSRVSRSLWKLLDEADMVVAHNGKNFDVKRANSKFLEHGLPPATSFHMIDTLLHSRKSLGEVSNRLDWLTKKFNNDGEGKYDSRGLWKRVMEKDYQALVDMDEYCQQDVRILEDYYLVLRPYIRPHPNVGLYVETDLKSCPTCGSSDLKFVSTYETTVNSYNEYRCGCCGSLSRSRKSNMDKNMREGIMSSNPR